MSYEVKIQGGLPGPHLQTEYHQIRIAISNMIVQLESEGHKFSTTFINDEPNNLQLPEEREAVVKAAVAWRDASAIPTEEASKIQVTMDKSLNLDTPPPSALSAEGAGAVPKK